MTVGLIDALELSGLVYRARSEPEVEYLFRHALVHEAAYTSLLVVDRKWLHRCVGETLERLYGGHGAAGELAPLLGRHFAEAGDYERALRYFRLAADAALQVYANAEAVAHYSRALEIAPLVLPFQSEESDSTSLWIHLYSNRGRALELSASYAQALDNYVEMEALAHQRNDSALELAALLAQVTLYITPDTEFNFAKGKALAEQALTLAHRMGDRAAEARIDWDLMRLAYWRGETHQALEYGEQALALARELGHREQLAFTLHDIHRPYLSVHRRQRAAEVLTEATRLWRELGNLPMLADALASAADMYYDNGEYARTFSLAQEAVHISQSIGNRWGQAFGLMMMSCVWLEQGEITRALEALEQAVDLSRSAGVVVLYLRLCFLRAAVHELLGDYPTAHRLIELAMADIERVKLSGPYWTGMPLTHLARLRLRAGDLDGANAILARLANEARGQNWRVTSWALQAETELALAREDYAHALASVEEMMAGLGKNDIYIPMPQQLYFKGRALAGQGEFEAARESLTQALAEAERIGSRLKAWPVLIALAQLEARCGDLQAASHWRQCARTLVEYILDHLDRPALRDSFLRLADVRAAWEAS